MMASGAAESIDGQASIRSILRSARSKLAQSDSPDLDARVLLAHVLDVEPAFLFAHGEVPLTPAQLSAFQNALARRAAGELIAYIIGRKGFYDLDLITTPAVLVPRPETELLLEEALRRAAPDCELIVADIGTGSGALAIAFARQRPRSPVYATDISAAALAIARRNAERYGVDVAFMLGNLAQPLIDAGIQVNLLMANLPYIARAELKRLAVSRHEPRVALDGGVDGLDCIRELLTQIPHLCRAGALVLLEIGADQGDAVTQLIQAGLGLSSRIIQDYAGLDRIVHFQI